MKELFKLLEELNIQVAKYEHEAVFTNEESAKINIPEVAQNAKNLFLRAEKTHKFYLLTIDHGKKADLKVFAKKVGEKGFSFGSAEELKAILNLTPGSVSPMGLMYDKDQKVTYYIDSDLIKAEKLYVHPNINTGTIGIKIEDFKKFLNHTGHTLYFY